MRSILVQAANDRNCAARLDTAMAVARASGGHVTLLIDTPIEPYVSTNPYGGSYVARDALEAAIKADDALAETLEGRFAHDDVPFDVLKTEGSALDAMLGAAKLADLAIVSRTCGFAGDLAIEADCPVLVLGSAALAVPVGTAVIAWDGGLQGARALRGAAPLLAGCSAVHVVTVNDGEKGDFPATDPLRYLSRHGITAELHEVPKSGSVEATIAAEAARLGASLLVMGAYSHTRLREFVFGGVTRHFLNLAAGPALLLAH
jgi:nucleotide-binding universal stress UspA family protein